MYPYNTFYKVLIHTLTYLVVHSIVIATACLFWYAAGSFQQIALNTLTALHTNIIAVTTLVPISTCHGAYRGARWVHAIGRAIQSCVNKEYIELFIHSIFSSDKVDVILMSFLFLCMYETFLKYVLYIHLYVWKIC